MENQLFDWDGWDQQDVMAFTFYKPVLKVQVGEFPAGASFDSVDLNYGAGKLTFYNRGPQREDGTFFLETVCSFKLGLTVLGKEDAV